MEIEEIMIQPNENKQNLTFEDYMTAYTLTKFIPDHEKVSSGKTNQHHDHEKVSKTMMSLLKHWYKAKPDTGQIFGNHAFLAERFSELIKKQLTRTDVDGSQGRLMLGKAQVKERMLPLLEPSESPKGTEGLDVSVYGPDPDKGAQKMKFKIWDDTPVLTSGWNGFVAEYGLEKHCHFLAVWMFRHKVTRKICFAIDFTEIPVYTLLSCKILKALMN